MELKFHFLVSTDRIQATDGLSLSTDERSQFVIRLSTQPFALIGVICEICG